mgnify:CR=1 FL=1
MRPFHPNPANPGNIVPGKHQSSATAAVRLDPVVEGGQVRAGAERPSRPGQDRFDDVRRLAAATGAVVLLKGPTTLVADPAGRVGTRDESIPWSRRPDRSQSPPRVGMPASMKPSTAKNFVRAASV